MDIPNVEMSNGTTCNRRFFYSDNGRSRAWEFMRSCEAEGVSAGFPDRTGKLGDVDRVWYVNYIPRA